MAKVFVSYSRADSTAVDRLSKALREAGHQVWIDRAGIRGGEIWRREIVEAIGGSDVLVLALSQRSTQSDNVRRELDLAESGKKRVIPVALEPVEVPAGMQYQLVGIQQIKLYKDYAGGMQELLGVLGQGQSPTAVPEEEEGGGGKKRLAFLSIGIGAVLFLTLGLAWLVIQSLRLSTPTPNPGAPGIGPLANAPQTVIENTSTPSAIPTESPLPSATSINFGEWIITIARFTAPFSMESVNSFTKPFASNGYNVQLFCRISEADPTQTHELRAAIIGFASRQAADAALPNIQASIPGAQEKQFSLWCLDPVPQADYVSCNSVSCP